MMKKILFPLILLMSQVSIANVNLDIAFVRNEQVLATGRQENIAANQPRTIHQEENLLIDATVLSENEVDAYMRLTLSTKNKDGKFEVQIKPEFIAVYNQIAALTIQAENPEGSFDIVMNISK